MPDEAKTLFRAVYVGLRYITLANDTNKLAARWCVLTNDGTLDLERKFNFVKSPKSMLAGGAYVGDVYDIEKEGDKFGLTTDQRLSVWESDTDRAAWLLKERAAQARLALERRSARETFGGLTLDDIKARYRKTVAWGDRAAYLMAVQQYITG